MSSGTRGRLAEFQFDLGRSIGMGHLRRCEALAVELASRGWENWGVCQGGAPDEDPLAGLDVDPRFPVSQHEGCSHAELVVVDSYLRPATQELKFAGARLLCYHDWAQSSPADLIVDCNLGADPAAYAAVGAAGRVLAGPDYFPVRSGLRTFAPASRERDRSGPARRLLITLGGSALRALAVRTIEELVAAGSDLEVRVAVSALAGPGDELLEVIGRLPGASVVTVGAGSDLGKHMAWADLAVSAAGLTKYELALLGVPAVILSIGDDQDRVATAFARAGTARYLGRMEKLKRGDIGMAVFELAADEETQRRMSRTGRELVDGRGAERIAEEIEGLVEATA